MSIKRIVIILLLTIIFGTGLSSYLGTRLPRGRGHDAVIRANLSNIHERAKRIYSINKNYSGLCANSEVTELMSSASSILGGYILRGRINSTLEEAGGSRLVSCHIAQDGKSWVIASSLIDKDADSWCVDSTGASKEINGYLMANATVCP